MEKAKVAFFGSSKYSLVYLEQLDSLGFEIKLVVSQPDKPSGRGLKERPNPTKEWAQKHQILCLTPSNLTDPLFLGAVKTLPLKLGLSAYYGLKIPGAVIERFPLGILNVHHSLLPKHKGPNPIPWAIVKGEEKTGTTIIEIDEKFDAGQIIAQAEEAVQPNDTTGTLRDRLDAKALELLKELLPRFAKGEIEPQKTTAESGSYEGKISKDMAKIDWKKSDEEIERSIRAFSPWPGAWSTVQEVIRNKEISNKEERNKRIKILKAHLVEGKLVIDEIQIEGKKPMVWKQFLSGYSKGG